MKNRRRRESQIAKQEAGKILEQWPDARLGTSHQPAIMKTGADRAQVFGDQDRRIAFDKWMGYDQKEESQQDAQNR